MPWTMERLLVVEHDHDAPAGLLAGWAAGRGLKLDTVRLHAGGTLPGSPADCEAAVVLGSEQTAYDDTVPWLAGELAFVRALVQAGVPVLGICFGGQVLARVLGARLYRLPVPEIGWVQARTRSPGLAAGPWLSWHRDAFDLPPGAAELAASDVSLQAFAIGPHAGLQFHPEATEPIARDWLAGADPRPGPEVTGPMFETAGDAWDRAAANAGPLFSAWLDGALAP
jgi:GMP synthase-like glutamine amidotransferase